MKFKQSIYLVSISILMGILGLVVIDFFLGKTYLNFSQRKFIPLESFDSGWYELKKSYVGSEKFGNRLYTVHTDTFGFRRNFNVNENKDNLGSSYDAIFLGDSFTYGSGVPNDQTVPSLFENYSGLKSLNGGVASYSPTAYLYTYKKALKIKGLMSPRHKVLIGLDISDIQDEAAIWMDGVSHPQKRNKGRPGRFFLEQDLEPKDPTKLQLLKSTIADRLPITYRVYSLLKSKRGKIPAQEKFTDARIQTPPNNVLTLVRSAVTFQDWKVLNSGKYDSFSPLKIEGALIRIEDKLREIIELAHKSGGEVYVYTYPWPPQVKFRTIERFAWDGWVREACRDLSCDGYLDVYSKVIKRSEESLNWYPLLYIPGDVHFNEKGNKFVAENVGKALNFTQIESNS